MREAPSSPIAASRKYHTKHFGTILAYWPRQPTDVLVLVRLTEYVALNLFCHVFMHGDHPGYAVCLFHEYYVGLGKIRHLALIIVCVMCKKEPSIRRMAILPSIMGNSRPGHYNGRPELRVVQAAKKTTSQAHFRPTASGFLTSGSRRAIVHILFHSSSLQFGP